MKSRKLKLVKNVLLVAATTAVAVGLSSYFDEHPEKLVKEEEKEAE